MVQNLISLRSNRPVANQFVLTTEKATYFQSYNTLIAKVEKNGKVTLASAWDYSATTSKYLYQFLKEYSGYSDLNSKSVKKLIKDKTFKYVNILTM